MNSFKYLAYGTVWIGIIAGSLIYGLLAGMLGVVFMYAAVLTLIQIIGVIVFFGFIVIVPFCVNI